MPLITPVLTDTHVSYREFLRFRSLLVRGRAETNELHEKIARLPNGACWKVLSYWREAE